MLMKSAITLRQRANDDEDISGLTALDLFTVVAQKYEAVSRIPTRACACDDFSPRTFIRFNIFAAAAARGTDLPPR